MSPLSNSEIDTITKILNIGLTKAAETLSFFMNDKVSIEAFDFQIETLDLYEENIKVKPDSKYILTTEVKGDIKGYCYLVFSKADTTKLFELGLPKNLLPHSQEFETMSTALLLELDNIVSASVITQFANLLSSKMHGGIPSLYDVGKNTASKNQFFGHDLEDSYILNFKSKFFSSAREENFSPEFIWILTPTFVEKVKESIAKSNKLIIPES
jgi:chemotaxis protein CheY-P-specific phosphatase CheC